MYQNIIPFNGWVIFNWATELNIRLMWKLRLQYFGQLMQRADSFEKTLMLGKTEGRRRKGWQRMRWLDGITDSVDIVWVNSWSWWWTGRPGMLQFMGLQRVGHYWVTEQNWTEYSVIPTYYILFIHSLVDGHYVIFIFWLLWIVLLWVLA